MQKIYVAGGMNIDIQGVPDNMLVMHDSNPGKITYSFGGVGRNVAENLARLGSNVYMISSYGDDPFAKAIVEHNEKIGIHMDHCLYVKGASTSVYLALMDHENDMAVALSDMHILEKMDESFIQSKLNLINEDEILVLDTNFSESMLQYVIHSTNARIYLDPISVAKAKRIEKYLDKLYMIKPNVYEAEMLSGIEIKTIGDVEKACNHFLDRGLQEVVISLGKWGVAGADKDGFHHFYCEDVNLLNATGGGDSLFAGFVHARSIGMNMEKALQFALVNSILNVESPMTVNPDLNKDSVYNKMQEIVIKKGNKNDVI